jgi:hypothetical protein
MILTQVTGLLVFLVRRFGCDVSDIFLMVFLGEISYNLDE